MVIPIFLSVFWTVGVQKLDSFCLVDFLILTDNQVVMLFGTVLAVRMVNVDY